MATIPPQAVAQLIKAAKNLISKGVIKDPARLKIIDDHVAENLDPQDAIAYRKEVYGEGDTQRGASGQVRGKDSFGEPDTQPAHGKRGYDFRQNIPEGNTGNSPKLTPEANTVAKEADEKQRRGRWRRKNASGVTTGDPFKELFGKSLTDLTKENSNTPFMYKQVLDAYGGDHNEALRALTRAKKGIGATESFHQDGLRGESVDDIFQVAARGKAALRDTKGDLDFDEVRGNIETLPTRAGETSGEAKDAAEYRKLFSGPASDDYDPSAIPQGRMTEGFETGEKIQIGGTKDPKQFVNPRERVWAILKKSPEAINERDQLELNRMGKAILGEFLEVEKTKGLDAATQQWGEVIEDLNGFLRNKEKAGRPLREKEQDLRKLFLTTRHHMAVKHRGEPPGKGYEKVVEDMEKLIDNPWKRYYRGSETTAPYAERKQALGNAWDEWNKSPLDEIDEDVLIPDKQKVGELTPRFGDDDKAGESLQMAAKFEEELGLKPRKTNEGDPVDQGFQRDPGDVFEGKVASIPRDLAADPDNPIQAIKSGTTEGQAYDLGGEMPMNLAGIKTVLSNLVDGKGRTPEEVLDGLGLNDRMGKSLIENPEQEAAVAERLLKMLESEDGINELSKIFDADPTNVNLGADNAALRSSGLGKYTDKLLRASRSQDEANIKAGKNNPRIEAHNTFMENRAKSSAARGEREYSQLDSAEIIPAEEHIGAPSTRMGTQMSGGSDDTIQSIKGELEKVLGATGQGNPVRQPNKKVLQQEAGILEQQMKDDPAIGTFTASGGEPGGGLSVNLDTDAIPKAKQGSGKTRPQLDDKNDRGEARKIVSLIDSTEGDPSMLAEALQTTKLDKTPTGRRILNVIQRDTTDLPKDEYKGITGPELHGRVAEAGAQKDVATGQAMQRGGVNQGDKAYFEKQMQSAIQSADMEAEEWAARGKIHPIVADRQGFIKDLYNQNMKRMGEHRQAQADEGLQREHYGRQELREDAPMRELGTGPEFEAGAGAINQMLPEIQQLVAEGKLTTEGGEALMFAARKMQDQGGDVSKIGGILQENYRGPRSVEGVNVGPRAEDSGVVTIGDISNPGPDDFPGRVVGAPKQQQIQEEFAEAGEDQVFGLENSMSGADAGGGSQIFDYLSSLLLPLAAAGGAAGVTASAQQAQAAEQQQQMIEEEKKKKALYNSAIMRQMNEVRP